MFTTSFVFTTLFATLCAVSSANAADLNAKNPVNPVQCQDTKLEWTGGVPPYNVYVFTDCKDDSDAPIATFTNIPDNSVTWSPTTLYSGDGFFYQVEDSTGADSFSDDAYLGGDADKVDECKQQIADVKASESASSVASTATSSAAPTASAAAADDAVGSDNIPTTMSGASSTTTPGASAVANAASDPSSNIQKAGSDKVANGASSLVARPVELALGVFAAGVVAFL